MFVHTKVVVFSIFIIRKYGKVFFRFSFLEVINFFLLYCHILIVDTLKLADDTDDWVHFDHCYTANYYGNRKPQRAEQVWSYGFN